MLAARKPAEEPATDALSMAELMLCFESIGWDCQFGMIQRCCGVEPLGLFRFTSSAVRNLAAVLDSDLADVWTAEDIELEVAGDEYRTVSRRFKDFSTHTNIRAADEDAATVLARERRKAAYLKKRFLLDWKGAERIYVHSGWESEAEILALHAALRRTSECWLLWVVVESYAGQRGRVEVLRPGLMRGSLGFHGTFGDDSFQADLPGWAMICRAAHAIVRGEPDRAPPDPGPIVASYAWASGQCGRLVCDERVGRTYVVHDCHYRQTVAEVTVAADLDSKRLVVFSVWIRLSSSFSGRRIMLTSDAGVIVNFRVADLAVRDVWQQIWLVMKIADPRQETTICLEVEAQRGSDILFAGWRLEDGAIAGETHRPSEETRAPNGGAAPMPVLQPRLPRSFRRWLAARLRHVAGDLDPTPDATIGPTEDSIVFDVLRLSNILMEKGRFDEADAILVAGKRLYPWRAELSSHYGLCAQLRADVPMAAARWAEVIDNFPQYAYAHYQLAAALRELGETRRALAVVEAALPHHLDDPGMVAEAARVYATAQHWPEAAAQWDRAVALAGDKPEWRDARAHAARMAARFPPDEGSAIKA